MGREIEQQELPFLGHLEVLRWHIIRAVIAILVCAIAAFVMKRLVFHHLILGPSRIDFFTYQMFCYMSELMGNRAFCIDDLPFTLQSRKMTGQFMMHVSASFVVGLIVSFPYAFYEIWRFIKPALYSTEQKVARGTVFFVSVLFFIGVLFGYYIISPISVNFLANYQVDPAVINEFDITSYVGTLLMITFACGIMFQMPMAAYMFSKAGLLYPEVMRKFQKHVFVGIMVISAVITPPDVTSQVLIAIPIFFLYQISIFISKVVHKNRMKDLEVRE